jgi:hypothetical protein
MVFRSKAKKNDPMKIPYVLLFILLAANAAGQKFIKSKIGSIQTTSCAFSPDRAFLTINDGSKILFFTAGTSTLVRELKLFKSPIVCLQYQDDGSSLLVVSKDNRVSLVDPAEGKIFATYEAKAGVLSAHFIQGRKVAFITDKTLAVYDFESAKLLFEKTEHLKPIRSLAVARNGKYLATGGGDGNVVLYHAADGAVILKKKLHDGWVRAMDINHDGSLFASCDDKGNIFISDLKGEPYARFDDIKGWAGSARFSDDGKYLAAGDERGSCFLYSVEKKLLSQKISEFQFSINELNFRNDGKELAVVEEMKGARVLDVSALNISPVFKVKDAKDHNPPQILVSNPPNIQNDRYRYSQDYMSIKGIVVDDSGVRSLKINGIETPLKENGNFTLYLPLAMGDNFVNIETVDVNDNIAVKKFIITRKNLDGEEYDVAKARNFLFVVGINEYEHWPKLNNAVKDANDIASVLLGQYAFEFGNVVVLKNEQATRSNIYKSLRGLIEQITPQDNLVIYYSGHGHFDELLNEGYWVPVDAKLGSSGDYLSNSDLLKIIGTINSQHTFLVADACFSGSLFSDSKRGYTENVEKFKSRWGLASGRLEVVSDGSLNENSPFTATVIEFLKKNEKDKFAVSELIQYVKVHVAEKANQTPLGNPLKGAGDEGGEFVFYKKK